MLEKELSSYLKIDSQHKIALSKLGIEKVQDILFHFPIKYGNSSEFNQIKTIEINKPVVIFGKIKNLKLGKTYRSKVSKSEATIEDDSGTIKATWFNQPYIAKMYSDGQIVKITGKVSEYNGKPFLNNPNIEKLDSIPEANTENLFQDKKEEEDQFLQPVYKLSKGISSTWFYYAIKKIISSDDFKNIEEYIPEPILKKYKLPSLQTALVWVHSPKNNNDALSARKRFAFEEVFLIQVQRQLQRKENESKKSYLIDINKNTLQDFTGKLPFKLTKAQEKSIKDIFKDFKTEKAMSRLLEGDVGSGKTAVAAATAYSVVNTRPENQDFGNLQIAYMAPTEVLARQLFENFIGFFEGTNIKIGLMTSSGCMKFPSKVEPEGYTKISKSQLLKWVENGEIPILIGTHSLISKSVKFKHLAYVIIDEQHRFGTNQRAKLAKKDEFLPHLLSMTATPIPRTLALTIYGDLDLTILDQMPSGRKPVITEITPKDKRVDVYEKIRKEIESGRQVYIICPRIEEPDPTKLNTLNTKSVKEEARKLREEIFPEFEVGEMHSKLKKDEKESVMKSFEDGELDILVSTSVIEVGVNVPNATNIIIEGSERFGLAQLHQLRGRVLRSSDQAYCYLFTDSKSSTTLDRLNALQTSKNGFELAEHDLKLRGSGELGGGKQWGVTDLGMEAIKNIKMVEAAREEAKSLVSENKTKENLLHKIDIKKDIHFE
jgi:ATP-dependent DNA helicase RecG